MAIKSNYEYLLSDLSNLKGVGAKTTNLLKKKKINNIFDLLWKLPKSYTDRSRSTKIKDLKILNIITKINNMWRRDWDSNPGKSCPFAGFQDRCFQPLSHLSV